MILTLLRVDDETLNNFFEDSSLLEERLYNDDAHNDKDILDLDKSWDGIVFLLTGESSLSDSENELARIFFSGNIIDGDQDLGYGPAHFHTSEEVSKIYNLISVILSETLKANYDAQKMEELEVYPSVWGESDEEVDYLIGYFNQLKAFYEEASNQNMAIISIMS